MDITRPRSASGMVVCTRVLLFILKARRKNPKPNIASRETQTQVEKPSNIAVPDRNISATRPIELLRKTPPSDAKAMVEIIPPTPVASTRNPYTSEPWPSTSVAITGIR